MTNCSVLTMALRKNGLLNDQDLEFIVVAGSAPAVKIMSVIEVSEHYLYAILHPLVFHIYIQQC